MDEQTGKTKGYVFVTIPTHISEGFMKLNGLSFTGKNLLIEEARKKTYQNDVNLPVNQDLKVSNNQNQDLVTRN